MDTNANNENTGKNEKKSGKSGTMLPMFAPAEDIDSAIFSCPNEEKEMKPSDWDHIGFDLLASDACEEAIIAFDNGLEMNPDHPSLLMNKADALSRLEKYDESLALYEKVRNQIMESGGKDNPENAKILAEVLTDMGLVCYRKKDMTRAMEFFNESLSVSENLDMTYAGIGLVLSEDGNFKNAIVAFDKALSVNNDCKEAWHGKAAAYDALGDDMEAVIAYNEAISRDMTNPNLWYEKALVFDRMGNAPTALKSYEKAIELDPEFENAWHNKGVLLSSMGEFEKAVDAFSKVIELDPSQADVWFNRGYTNSVMEDYDDALQDLFKTIEIDPDFEKAYEEIGYIYTNMGFLSDALNYFEKSLAIKESAESWFGKYFCLKKMSEDEKAAEALEKAAALDPRYRELAAQQE